MDRLRHLTIGLLLAAALSACESKPAPSTSGRFNGVKTSPVKVDEAARKFCDTLLPAAGPDAKRFTEPPTKPIPGYREPESQPKAWRWINLWATWCGPCVEEMPLINRWKNALAAEGAPIDLELLSVDEDEATLVRWLKRPMPGRVRWLEDAAKLDAYLQTLGLDSTSAIPIHALVDPDGALRCVRVGAIREQEFGSVRALITGR